MRNQWRIKSLIGQKFNMLTVVDMVQSNPVIWRCRCDCGNYTNVRTSNLKRGLVKSCGCLHHRGNPAHNLSNTRLYKIRAKMIRRCFCKDDQAYPRYGGRGITMCDEWRDSVEAFAEWAYANGYRDDLSIDRIDNNGNYSPQNCRWATSEEQANNTRRNKVYTFNGETKNLKHWCNELGLKYSTVHMRLLRGWSFEEAITTVNDARLFKRKEKQDNE